MNQQALTRLLANFLYIGCGICVCNFLWFIQQPPTKYGFDAWMNLFLAVLIFIIGLGIETRIEG